MESPTSHRRESGNGNAFTRPFRQTADDFRDPERPAWKKVGLAFVLAFMAFSLVLAGFMAYALLQIPSAPSVAELQRETNARPTTVLAADGSQIAQFERQGRLRVPLDSVAAPFINALLAVEDRRFYEHDGIDWRRTVRAGTRTARGRMEGGSTLTQQLARNLYPDEIGRSISIRRKIKEIITARRIERSQSKEQILEAYVNTVPFLYNAFGVEMAARTYFDVHAWELNELQAATLVGMLKGTSLYNPVRNPERALERRNLVLAQMARHGFLEPARLNELHERDLELDFEPQDGPTSEYPHFSRYVREWLSEWADARGYDIFSDGLVVHTTLDPEIQRSAEEAVRRRGEQLQQAAEREWGAGFSQFWARHRGLEEQALRQSGNFRQAVANGDNPDALLDSLRANPAMADSIRRLMTRLEVGFVALHPRTGHIKAWVGSRDFNRTPYDHVWQSRRQPGSTFKPFVYAAALRRGFQPGDTFIDEQTDIQIDRGRVWRPANAGNQYTGEPMTLTEALAYSKNTVTAQLMMEVGPAYVASLARDAGIRQSRLEPVPSLALGVSEVTLLEITSAHATLANGGRYQAPVPVTRIENSGGRVLAEFGSRGEQVLPEDVAQTVVHMLRGAIDRGTGRRIRNEFGVTVDVAGKTGTSQNGADGWFVLMHPELVAASWVGFPSPRVTFRTSAWGQGSRNALLVVGDFFRDVQGSLPEARFETPARYRDPDSIWQRARSWWGGIFRDDVPVDESEDTFDASEPALPDFDDYEFSRPDRDEDFDVDSDDLDDIRPPRDTGRDADPARDREPTPALPPQAAPEPRSEPEPEPSSDDNGRTAVQRLYERTGEDLDQDLDRSGSPPD
jgi:penicillin-binding protein 1A